MALDPSVILQGQAPQIQNPLTAATQAATMANLIQEHQSNQIKLNEQQRTALENQTVRDALKNNTQVDENGNAVTNRQATIGDLTKAGLVQQARTLQLNWRAQDLQKIQQTHEMAGPIVMSIDPNDPTSWENAKTKSAQMGLPSLEDQLPPFSSPNFPAALRNFQKQYLSTAQSLEQQNKQTQFGIQQQEANAKTQEARAKAAEAGLPVGGIGGAAPAGGNGAQTPVASGQPQSLSAQDPADLLKQVPMKDRDKVAAQIDAAKNAVQNGPKILKAHDDAYGQHGVDYVPGMLNADQKAFHALMGPTFKDVEGTVRQAAMDNMFENTTPQFGDRGNTPQTKRNAVKDYLQDKSAASLSKSYGIDLSKFKSTNVKAALDSSGNETQQKISRLQELRAKAAGGNH